MEGIVKWYNIKQGYGFITSNTGEDIFVHKNDIPFWTIFLRKGDKIEFKKRQTTKGVQATNLKVL